MPKIIVKNMRQKSATYSSGKTLLSILQANYIDWMHACGAKGRCTTCSANIESGAENIASLTAVEEKYLQKGQILPNQRLACQAICTGDVEISVPHRYKLPHISYSD